MQSSNMNSRKFMSVKMFDTCLMHGLGCVFITLHGPFFVFAKGFAFCLFIKGRPKSVRQLGIFEQKDGWSGSNQFLSFINARSCSKSHSKATCTISIDLKGYKNPGVNHQFRSSVDSNVTYYIAPHKQANASHVS